MTNDALPDTYRTEATYEFSAAGGQPACDSKSRWDGEAGVPESLSAPFLTPPTNKPAGPQRPPGKAMR